MTAQEIARALAEPFPPSTLGWKPQAVSGNRALAVAYIDARDVMDRLDQVVGPHSWQDFYDVQASGMVVCSLRVCFEDSWVQKMDVGGSSDQPDAGDRIKSAFSDALKRAAVKFGIGRYLYSVPAVWVDYDPQKKILLKQPTLPAWALPKTTPEPAPTPSPDMAQRSAELLREFKGRLLVAKTKQDLEKLAVVIAECRNVMVATDLQLLRASYKATYTTITGSREPGDDTDAIE